MRGETYSKNCIPEDVIFPIVSVVPTSALVKQSGVQPPEKLTPLEIMVVYYFHTISSPPL